MVSVIQKTLCNFCVKPWKSQLGPQAVAILSSLSSISLLKISIIPLLLYSLHVQHLTFYLILFLFFFPIKLINQLRTNPTSEKKKKRHIPPNGIKHTYFTTLIISDSHHTLFSNQSSLFISNLSNFKIDDFGDFFPPFSFSSLLFLSQDFKPRKNLLTEISGYPAQNSAQSHSWNSSIFQMHEYLYTYACSENSWLLSLSCFPYEKIPKNPISRLSYITDSSICKLAQLHNVSYKLHALQICTCTPESRRIIN